ncbi:hypothetical protein ACHAC9_01650 [Massilia sp. CMS3.1]|uniref:hypothetical protein n=1 Tax=Massilia sp. CMS3.1 TaxID=3373083 RepID=UPI003EE5E4FE
MTTGALNSAASTPDAATVGIGGTTSGQAGATPAHETQQETGGSGGAQLTHSTGEIDAPPGTTPAPSEAKGSAMQTGARGAQDTQAQQAGGTGTGLGSRESGANQSDKDLPPAQ